jgi:hypothetical protein
MKNAKRFLWTATWILTAIGVALVLRRIGIICGLGRYLISPRFPFDSGLNKYPVLTIIHILPGLFFMILGPLQFMRSIRQRFVGFYRITGNIFIGASYIIGVSALIMPFIILPLGGLNEAVASSFFAVYFLIAISRALNCKLKKEQVLYREWLIRAYAIGLAIATVRPIMALSYAFFHVKPQDFLGTAFWMGFCLHAITAEIWISYSRKAAIQTE